MILGWKLQEIMKSQSSETLDTFLKSLMETDCLLFQTSQLIEPEDPQPLSLCYVYT